KKKQKTHKKKKKNLKKKKKKKTKINFRVFLGFLFSLTFTNFLLKTKNFLKSHFLYLIKKTIKKATFS
ncbi:hypothetical protein ACSTLL_23050, partial [Vibrio parahaemolyticus]